MNRDIDVRTSTTDVSTYTYTRHRTVLLSMICAAMYGVASPALAVSPLDDSQLQAQSISLVPLTTVKKQKEAQCTVLKKQKSMKQMTPEERRECGVQQSDDGDDTGNASITASDDSGSGSDSDGDNAQASSDGDQTDQLDASDNAGSADGSSSNNGSGNELSDDVLSTSDDVSGNSGGSDFGATTDTSVSAASGNDGSGTVARGGFDPSSLPDSLSPEDQSMLGLGLGSNLADTNVTAGIASLDASMVSNDLLNSALDFQSQQLLTNMNGAGGTLLVLDEIALGELRKSPYTLLIDGANDNGAQDSSDFSYQGYESFYIYESVNGSGINDGTDFEIPSISAGPGQVSVIGR